jgi:hypothetical protein
MRRHQWALAALVLGGCSGDPLAQGDGDSLAVDTLKDDTQNSEGDIDAQRRGGTDSASALGVDGDAPSEVQDSAGHDDGTQDGITSEDTADASASPEDVTDEGEVPNGGLDGDSGAPCSSYGAPQASGTLPPALTEASGLAASTTQAGVLWVHNDSGDKARIYAIQESGERLATVTLDGTHAYDWEDMARGPCSASTPLSSCLYVGDIGDNSKVRTYIKVHRVPEPDVALGDHTITSEGYDTMTAVYPDGPRDCEALVIDGNGHIYLLSKEWSDSVFRLYGSPFLPGAELVPLQFLSEHDISGLGGTVGLVTAASYSPALNRLLVRTYGAAFEYQLGPGETLSQLPWASVHNVPVANEGQGEAITYGAGGYWHVSEGKEPPIWRVLCE